MRHTRTLLTAALLIAASIISTAKIKVTDTSDSSPVTAAVVFSRSGLILGMTDADGIIENTSEADYPLSIRCLGYEPAEITAPAEEHGLTRVAFPLKEITVSPAERPITRIVCYRRTYMTAAAGSDTLQGINISMFDVFISKGKVKGFRQRHEPRDLISIDYVRRKHADSDSVSKNNGNSSLSLLKFPFDKTTETDAVKGGAPADSVDGKHFLAQKMRKSDDAYIILTDGLADYKDHKTSPLLFKLVGMTTDVHALESTWAYAPNPSGEYYADDILYGTLFTKMTMRGKLFKSLFDTKNPIETITYEEIYPVSREYLTVEEAKELTKEIPATEIHPSDLAAPILPRFQRLIEQAEAEAAAKNNIVSEPR